MRKKLLFTVSAMVIALLGPAEAQSVAERLRAAEGVRLGGFVLAPSARAEIGWTDNVFADEANAQEDTFGQISAALDLQSNWSRHGIGVALDGRARRHQDFTSQNTEEVTLTANGRLDVTGDDFLFATLRFDDVAEPLSEAEPSGVVEPINLQRIEARGGADITFNRLSVRAQATRRSEDYEDARLGGGRALDQDQRDLDTTEVSVRAAYERGTTTSVFAEVIYNDRAFETVPQTAIRRDSQGFEALAGLSLDLTNLVRGYVAGGYFSQEFERGDSADVDGGSLSVDLDWFATPILTIGLEADRGFSDVGVVEANAAVSTAVGLRADYEFRRHIVFDARARTEHSEFRGIDREDERRTFGVGALYRLSRGVGVTARYSFADQDSSGRDRGERFSVNQVTFGVRIAL